MSKVIPDNPTPYEIYEGILENINSPQRQGMDEDEFSAGMLDPSVLKTEISGIGIPQLAPTEQYSWLNTSHYELLFPQEAKRKALLHYVDIIGIEPSDEVKGGLLKLAENEGVIVFDHADIDEAYPERIKKTLGSLGIESSGVIEVGTQVYFGGKVRLKRGHNSRKPIKSLHDAFGGMVKEGIVPVEATLNGATYAQNIELVEAGRLYEIYANAFQELNHHPCRQGLAPQEFFDVVTSEPESAKLRFNVNGRTVTLMILGDDLSKYPWIREDFYRQTYPEEYMRRQILYFPALCTDPKAQGEAYSEHIVNLIADMVEYGNNEIIVAFDCCDLNDGFLDKYIETLVNNTPEASLLFDRLGEQKYRAFKLSI